MCDLNIKKKYNTKNCGLLYQAIGLKVKKRIRMAMTACYPNYDMSSLSNSQSMPHHHHHPHHASMQPQQQSHSSSRANILATAQQTPQTQQQPPQKDYSIPLHVDCSVEYELPNQAKPPVGARVEPLLMIHPCYFRKMESQRRSPFINNMPNSTTSSSAVSSSSSSRSSQNSQSQRHMNMNPHQNLQQQIDEYVQRQMVHISQQAQYPSIGQSQQPQSNQYNLPTQQQIHSNNSGNSNNNWDNHNFNNPNSAMLGKVNIPNQNAYKKSGNKRHLSVATCANSYSTTGAGAHYEGALPNGMTTRWDEKTVMASIPRDYTETLQQHHQQKQSSSVANACNIAAAANMYRGGNSQQQAAVLMNSGSNTKRDRDPMLSGGCIYNNSNNSNLTTDINSLVSSTASGLWPIQKSPMAAIPNNYHQAGPDSIPNNHSSNSNSNKTSSNGGMTHRHHHQPPNTVIHHSHYAQQPPSQSQRSIHHSDKVNNNNNNSSSNNNNNNNVITVKYRQYRNSHRMHPYMMSNVNAPTATGGNLSALSGVSYFPQLANGSFPQIQQVSCYNV